MKESGSDGFSAAGELLSSSTSMAVLFCSSTLVSSSSMGVGPSYHPFGKKNGIWMLCTVLPSFWSSRALALAVVDNMAVATSSFFSSFFSSSGLG